jgi:LysR family transcriptional regulator, regulator for metE and metH
MIERSHLQIILALDELGTLTQAAEALCLSQSALSHQIRKLEELAGVRIWHRIGRTLYLTPAGRELLKTARQVLPVLEQSERTLTAYRDGKRGLLRIGVECYPCYAWLKNVVVTFMAEAADVDIDIVSQFQFRGLEALREHHIDLLITPDPVDSERIHFERLFDYEVVLVMNDVHPLTAEETVQPEMLAGETLLTFPVPAERLDIFNRFLAPAGIAPRERKEIESVDIMLQMVAFQRGVCALPEWLAAGYLTTLPLTTARLGQGGLNKSLFAALRAADLGIRYFQEFIELGKR